MSRYNTEYVSAEKKFDRSSRFKPRKKINRRTSMKFLPSIVLVVAALIELSMADNAAVEPPKDKLYPIYDLIATRQDAYNKKEISILGSIYTELLAEYNTYLESHNTKPYQDYKAAIEKFLKSVQQFENDQDNCNLQRAAKLELSSAAKSKPVDDELNKMVNKAYQNKLYKQEYKNLVDGFTAQFPEVIKNFVEALDESEKQKYDELYKLGQEFVKASDEHQQFRAFQNFIVKIKFTENTTSATDGNCKWDVTNFDTFVNHISTNVFIDLSSYLKL